MGRCIRLIAIHPYPNHAPVHRPGEERANNISRDIPPCFSRLIHLLENPQKASTPADLPLLQNHRSSWSYCLIVFHIYPSKSVFWPRSISEAFRARRSLYMSSELVRSYSSRVVSPNS